jgi:hypothetical protein
VIIWEENQQILDGWAKYKCASEEEFKWDLCPDYLHANNLLLYIKNIQMVNAKILIDFKAAELPTAES